VANIEKYNAISQEKIEIVATTLLKSGYEVDIVAGSSFKKMSLDVEGIGTVEEPWTTLGVAQELDKSWNDLSLITTILFATFSFVWFVGRLTFEKSILEKENELLSIIGWQRKRIILRNCFEQYLLLIAGYILSIPFIVFLKLDISAYLIATSILIIAIALTSFIFTNNSKKMPRVNSYKRLPSIFHYKSIILPTMLVLFISTIVIVIQLSNLGNSIDKAKETTLGQFTGDETIWIHLSIFISTLLLSFLGLSECINALLSYRKTELTMYHIIGWTRKRILTHLSKEIFIWAGTAISFGSILGCLILLTMGISYGWILIGIASSVGILSFAIIIVLNTKNLIVKN